MTITLAVQLVLVLVVSGYLILSIHAFCRAYANDDHLLWPTAGLVTGVLSLLLVFR